MSQAGHYDAIILGAGMSGLAAGIRLAHYQRRVCILERHAKPGGLNSYYRLNGRNLDTGLHAVTNYVGRELRTAPLNKLLRQLRIGYDELALCPQSLSEIRFPQTVLQFSNEFTRLESEVCQKFPRQADGFRRLVQHLRAFNAVALDAQPLSARKVVAEFLSDPLLIDMLFCPLCYYGSALEDDMDFSQFVLMFKSIFLEGFARPREGVRRLLAPLLKKYKANGGELRLRTGAKALRVEAGRVTAIELDNGETLSAGMVLSSAGLVETLRLCSDSSPAQLQPVAEQAGQMSFFESISELDLTPAELGLKTCISFVNMTDRFSYRRPEEPLDLNSAVVCCPDNYHYDTPLGENLVRVTNIARHQAWMSLDDEVYRAQKQHWYQRSLAKLSQTLPDIRGRVRFSDCFTPRTVYRFTGHLNGAVYGAPAKIRSGRTRLNNLFLCGTDQGFLGIVGALLSGISMANLHGLQSALKES